MRTRPADVLYCGVNEEKIKNANPTLNIEVLKYLHLYLTERHYIYKKKEIDKQPSPWTTDDVLGYFRFTNTRRELDRESQWLIKNISSTNMSLEKKVLWSILFRVYNKSQTMEKLKFPDSLDISSMSDKAIERVSRIIDHETSKDPKYVWFTSAFNSGGPKFAHAFPDRVDEGAYLNQPTLECTVIQPDGTEETWLYKDAIAEIRNGSDIKMKGYIEHAAKRPLHMMKYIVDKGLHTKILQAEDQKDCFLKIRDIHGIADFLAYQIFVDLTYIPEFPFSENEFTVSGPGCKRGLDLLFENRGGMNHDEALFWVRDYIGDEFSKLDLSYDPKDLYDHLPPEDRCLNVMMVENAFCELSKLVKAKTGTGRPRVTYKPS